jgi:hypothetical protein
MEIHAPHERVESLKDFLLHIGIVTIGILIALGLEQAVEAYRHHELAENARAGILSELRDNKKSIDAALEKVNVLQQEHRDTIRTLDLFLAKQPLKEASLAIHFNFPTLTSTSWSTAQSTGALSLMNYAEVKRFAGVYDTQQVVLKLHDEILHATSLAAGRIDSGAHPDKAPPDELKEMRLLVQQSLTEITIWVQVASQLSKQYAAALMEK